MRYDPATQAALSDPLGWILLLLLVAALVTVSVVAVFGALALAARRRQVDTR
jgi:hypothetical protein